MAGRQSLTDEQFGREFFQRDRAGIAIRVREIMARHITVDLSRLHPDDRIVEDLRMDALDSMSTVEFAIDLEKEFGISISDADAARLTTLRAVIDHVAEATRNKTV
jgi:acyl carrier protein